MPPEEVREIVKEFIKELREEGVHADCPFSGVEAEKIQALKDMPTGAFKMVCMTWGVVSQFGNWCGKGIAVGLFIVVLAVLAIGGISLLKLWGLFR